MKCIINEKCRWIFAYIFQATFQYLEDVRKTIQNEKYQSLLSLSQGSALAVALDVSGSMGNEIEAVKKEILDIIDAANAGGTGPSVYIIAPYGGTLCDRVDVTVTKDVQKVKEILEGLSAGGGCEIVFHALQVW